MDSTSDFERPDNQQNGATALRMAGPSTYVNAQYLEGGPRSLSGISTRAYGLGIALGISSLISAELAYFDYSIWRAPFFIAVLAVFHYLEFDSTARYNPSDAATTSFLLLSNGIAYSVAHATAMSECLLRYCLRSGYKPEWLAWPRSWSWSEPGLMPDVDSRVPVGVGIFLIVMGQLCRREAMRKAKTSFNHLVQFYKKEDHVLVTDGIYAISRHPAYFGFYWWAMGTQLVLGNHFCTVAYAVVLWKFFSHRIMRRWRLF
jgi:protein-S-isoprenylcysteine O-methyltransferase